MGFFSKLGKALKFDFAMGKKLLKTAIKNPKQLLLGAMDPVGAKIANTLFGTKFKAPLNVMGGPSSDSMAEYEAKHGEGSLGFAPAMHKIAETVAGFYAGGALAKVGGQAFQAVKGAMGAGGQAAATSAASSVASGAAKGVGQAAGNAVGQVAGDAVASAAPSVISTAAPAATNAATTGARGMLSKAFDVAKSEAGMNIIGGAMQGYGADQAQRRAIAERNSYTRPFTSEEVASINNSITGVDTGGFLSRARRVNQFLSAPVTGPTMSPDQVAALARGGT